MRRRHFFTKILVFLGLGTLVQWLHADWAMAWGPGVHTLTALHLMDNLKDVLPSVAQIITAHPFEYLYGCMSADFFIGKGKKDAGGHPHHWEGGFQFLKEARDEQETSYAYGFLSHLAADVAAHHLFVPKMLSLFPPGNRMGHVYWELKADYWIGADYMSLANQVLRMDHQNCDAILGLIGGKSRNRLGASKLLYTQSVKFYGFLHANRRAFMGVRAPRWPLFPQYLGLTLDLSCRLVRDLLANPESSPCLRYDPMGKVPIELAGRKWFRRRFRRAAPRRDPFVADPDLLKL